MDGVDLIYVFNDEASKEVLTLKNELFKYLIKVRRHSVGDEIAFRSHEDIKTLHIYEITDIEPKKASLRLKTSKEYEVKPTKQLHIGWCKIDAKSIEKVLASLSEIGVYKITFIECERSQRNIKLDFKRFDRILEASMQQCGSTHKIIFDESKSLNEFIEQNPHAKMFDFTQKTLDDTSNIDCIIIGCEGGFSHAEKEFSNKLETFRLNTPLVLRSESAAVAISSKIIL